MADSFVTLLTPANNSGVLGIARTSLDGNVLTVDLAASGLAPDQQHPFHLHGLLSDTPSQLATSANDADGDGFVETAEGEAAFGPVLAGLTTLGKAGYFLEYWQDAFPAADAQGNLSFHQSYDLDPADPNDAAVLAHVSALLEGRVLELHGLNTPGGIGAGTGGEVSGGGIPGTIGYNPVLPVAEGLVLPAVGDLGTADTQTFLDRAETALQALAPYTLNPAGTGPIAPEPAGTAISGASEYVALLQPSNGSGAVGFAVASIDAAAATVTVDLYAAGLTPGEVHASHIHGFANGAPSLLPNLTLDADKDGFVEDAEGEPVVGPVILALTTDGSITSTALPGPGVNFPVADANGNVAIRETYAFTPGFAPQDVVFAELEQRLAGREVQIHGLLVPATEGEGTPGEVNGTAGYKANLPVANGVFLPVDGSGVAADVSALAHAVLAPYGLDTPLV